MAVDLDDGRFVAGQKPTDTQTDARAPGRDTQVPGEREVIVTEPQPTERREAREYAEMREPLERETLEDTSPTEAGFASVAYAALRITTGVILAAHGFNKLVDFPAWAESVRSLKLFGMGIPLPTTMAALSLFVEFGGGIALVLGLCTRLASLGVFVNMLVAILTVHAGHGLFAQNGGYEFPLLLLMASVLFFADGSGRYGIDARLFHALRERRAARRERRPHLGPHYAH